jgi:hypothetical protein
MRSIIRLSVWGATLLFPLAGHTMHIPTPLELNHPAHFTRRQLNPDYAQQELGPQLSSSTTIFGPTDDAWANATERYSTYAPPKIQLVVIPGEESDISTIVSFPLENIQSQLC